jgi:hypothetical protein
MRKKDANFQMERLTLALFYQVFQRFSGIEFWIFEILRDGASTQLFELSAQILNARIVEKKGDFT